MITAMRNEMTKWMIVATLVMSVMSINESKAQEVSLQVFYNELEPYGTWMHHANYGYVWIPRVERGFVPYGTNGYWINTEFGNTWVSYYTWGWAPFHYGRWFYDDFHGWLWVPDTVWGPAWVAWRSGGGYYGWAPLMPGLGINVSFNYYSCIPNYYWNFVPYRYIAHRNVYNHCVSRPRAVTVIHHTTIVTHNQVDNRKRSYFTGPSRSDIENRTHQRVEVYKTNDRVRSSRSDVDRGTVSFYKPDIDNSREANSREVPSSYMQDERVRNRVESSREVPSETRGNRMPANSNTIPENIQSLNRGEDVNHRQLPDDVKTFERSQQLERDNQNRSFQNFKNEHENIKRDQPEMNQHMTKPVERQNDNRPVQNYQHQREANKPAPVSGNTSQRTPDRQPQRMQSVEHQSPTQINRGNSQPERSSFKPADTNRSSTSQPQREQQIRRDTDNRSNQPSRSDGEKKPSPSRGR